MAASRLIIPTLGRSILVIMQEFSLFSKNKLVFVKFLLCIPEDRRTHNGAEEQLILGASYTCI